MSKIPVTITLYMSEILYDIQNKTYLTGRSRGAEEHSVEHVSHMQASDDDEDLNQILRSVGNAYSALNTKLSEYMDETAVSGNDIQIESTTDKLYVKLVMPSNFNMATTSAISTQLHQFIVNMAIGDWFSITNKKDAEDYIKMAAVNIDQIRESINKRIRPTRRTAGSQDSRFDPAPTCATPAIEKISTKVSMACNTTGATIRYTTDGSTPSESSTIYTAPISVGSGLTVKAYATRSGMADSAVATYLVP